MFRSFTQSPVIHRTWKTARAQYVEGQEALRRGLEEKRLEKEGARLISQMLYGVPPICKSGHVECRTHLLTPCSESSKSRGLLGG